MARRFARSLWVGIGVFASVASLGCPLASPLPDLGGREVKVAIENAYPPFNQIHPETGQAEGWDYDVIGEMARRLNFQPVYTQVPFSEIIDAVAAGTYDMAGDGISITYTRAQIVDYSRQYMIVRQRVAIRAGESRFRTLAELKADPNLIVGAERVSANYEAAVAYFGADRVLGLEGFEATIQALLDGTIDGAVVDDVAYWVQRQIHPGELSRLPGVLYGNLLGFIFPKGSDLIDPINQAITAMEADGTLQHFNDKWLALGD